LAGVAGRAGGSGVESSKAPNSATMPIPSIIA
jgi:hypothetical protein